LPNWRKAPLQAYPARYGRIERLKHDPEKWAPVFGKDHAQARSMIPKSGHRFSEKIMLKQEAKAKYESAQNHFALAPLAHPRAGETSEQ
jgi:hypothetical protein